MHILIIPSERYVPKEDPLAGLFQSQQAHSIQRIGVRVGVISYEPRSLRFLEKRITGWPIGTEFEDDQGIPIYRHQGWSWVAGRVPYLAFLFRIGIAKTLFKKYIADQGLPDVIHAHNAIFAGAVAAVLRNEYNIPYVLTEHSSVYASGQIPRWQIPVVTNAFRNANKRIVVSTYLGKLLETQFGNTVCPWEWIPNVLEKRFEQVSTFDNPKVRTAETFRFLNVAGLTKIKNHALLLNAFASRFKGKENVYLRIGGQGPLLHKLQALTESFGLTDQVVFLGLLSRDQVDYEMQNCNAFVLSSDHETFGVVLVEALAHGKPVIAISGSGPDSIIHPGNGILVPPKDAVALGNAMEEIFLRINDYDGRMIQTDCFAQFSEISVAEKLKNVFREVLVNS